jgi:hypothetical protein
MLDMNAKFLTTFLLVPCCLCGGADGAGEPALLVVSAFPGSVQQFGAVQCQIELVNEGNAELKLHRALSPEDVTCEVQPAGRPDPIYSGMVVPPRRALHAKGKEIMEPDPPPPLKAGARLKLTFLLAMTRDAEGKLAGPLFVATGHYRVRFRMPRIFFYSVGKLAQTQAESSWWDFEVVPGARDAEPALRHIERHPNPGWLFEPEEAVWATNMAAKADWMKELSDLLREAPGCYWAPFAHYALAVVLSAPPRLGFLGADEKAKYRTSLTEALAHLKAIGTVQDFPQKAASDALAARLSAQLGVAVRPNPLHVAEQELAAEFYDLTELSTNPAAWARAYRRESLLFYDLAGTGKISMEEAQRRDGEMLKETVRKNCRPLSPEEWKARHDAYVQAVQEKQNKEREAQRKAADERWRHILEQRRSSATNK